ncbi:MAG: LLM class flavin-dependent oxidoreductase [Actinomycetota bacterium]|nr:LLM class flavin-dependent oxidoreductase [Actinomycetota bacterium]
MPELRFGMLVVPDEPFPTLAERWRRVEELGFDFLFVADHYRHTRNASLPWFDGWTALAAMALQTTKVRIGPLVANPILRGPAVLAKAAAALDHLSDGRLELAIGKGVEEFDHRATGTPFWSPRERAARFREYVQVVDGVLRSWETPFSFEGRYYGTQETSLAPAPVQRPRPPITVGGQSPTVRRLAAERADCWNTFALGDVPLDKILETVRHQNLDLDELCTELGREPMKLRRSLVLWKPLDPWEKRGAFEQIVATFRTAGITEFIVMWPPEERLPLLERAASMMALLKHS